MPAPGRDCRWERRLPEGCRELRPRDSSKIWRAAAGSLPDFLELHKTSLIKPAALASGEGHTERHVRAIVPSLITFFGLVLSPARLWTTSHSGRIDMAAPKTQDMPPARSVPTSVEFVDDTIDLRTYLEVLRKRWLGIFAITAIIIAVGAVWTMRQPRIYKAGTSIIIDPRAPRVLQDVSEVVDIGAGGYWQTKEFYETEIRVIQSRQVSRVVVEKLGLDQDLDFLGLADIEDPELQRTLLDKIDPVKHLQSMISVEPVRDSRMVWVAVSDVDPRRAALLSTELASAYIDLNLVRRAMGAADAIEWLDEQMRDLRPRLEASELALYEFRRDNDMLSTSLEDRQNIISQRLQDLNATLTELRIRRVQLETRVERIKTLREAAANESAPAFDSLADVSRSVLVERLKQEYFRKVHEYAAMRERYLERHPNLTQAREALESARTLLNEEIEKIVASIENEYIEVRDAERRIELLIREETVRAHEVNRKEVQYAEFLRSKEEAERLYNLVHRRLEETGLTAEQRTNNVRMVDEAVVPERPVSPRVRLNLALSAVIGLFMGVGLAFVREILDNTVSKPDDIEKELGVSFLGIMPEVAERATGKPRADLHVFDNSRGSAAEACRSIRTNLLFMSTETPLKRLLVTSAGPKEGKTTMVLDLGVVMAQSGSKVVLVDTDMRRPRLHRALGMENTVGISNLLLGDKTLDDALQDTEVDGLKVLMCGPIPPNPAELLHTESFHAVLEELSQRFDRVLLDSPPLTAVADAKVLSKAADGTLVVIKSQKTTKAMARHALDALEDVDARILGVVLNYVDVSRREYGEYYYYYRRYGEYYGSDRESESA